MDTQINIDIISNITAQFPSCLGEVCPHPLALEGTLCNFTAVVVLVSCFSFLPLPFALPLKFWVCLCLVIGTHFSNSAREACSQVSRLVYTCVSKSSTSAFASWRLLHMTNVQTLSRMDACDAAIWHCRMLYGIIAYLLYGIIAYLLMQTWQWSFVLTLEPRTKQSVQRTMLCRLQNAELMKAGAQNWWNNCYSCTCYGSPCIFVHCTHPRSCYFSVEHWYSCPPVFLPYASALATLAETKERGCVVLPVHPMRLWGHVHCILLPVANRKLLSTLPWERSLSSVLTCSTKCCVRWHSPRDLRCTSAYILAPMPTVFLFTFHLISFLLS